jgi:hypothetical protein
MIIPSTFIFTAPSTVSNSRFFNAFLNNSDDRLETRVISYEKNSDRLLGGLASMGKTVESFRIALEGEINRWSGFARALRKPDREAFDELMDMCRTYASESSCTTNPIVFEPMVMSILLA